MMRGRIVLSRRKRSSQKREIVERHFDALSSHYDQTSSKRGNFFSKEHSLVASDMQSRGTARGLDVGVGTASRTTELQKASGAVFDACDFSEKMVDIAKERIPTAKHSEMTSLHYSSNSFGAVTCLGYSFSYLPDRHERLQALCEFNRVLQPSGVLYFDVANRWHLGENREYAKQLAKNIVKLPFGKSGETFFKVEIEGGKIDGYLHSFRLGELKSLLQTAGFEIEKVIYIGFSSGKIKKGFSRRLFGQPLIIAKKRK